MIKKLPLLLVIAIALFSCEAESFDDATLSRENTPGLTPGTDQEKIIDQYNETDGGLEYNTVG